MKGVNVLEGGALGEQQQVGVAAGADGRVGAQRPILGEVLAGGEELPFILRARLGIPALPGGVELEEGELGEGPIDGHGGDGSGCAPLALARRTGGERRPGPRRTRPDHDRDPAPRDDAGRARRGSTGMAVGLISAGIGSVPAAQT